jgi:hypothetical protein
VEFDDLLEGYTPEHIEHIKQFNRRAMNWQLTDLLFKRN